MKTIFCDIDGTIVFHHGLGLSGQLLNDAVTLPAVIERMNEWQAKGYSIVLTTGRCESIRKRTEDQLTSLGVFWDHLIMGLPNGPRVLVNDLKPGVTIDDCRGRETAIAVCVERNGGLKNVEI